MHWLWIFSDADLLVPLAQQVGEGDKNGKKIREQRFLQCKGRDGFGDVMKIFSSQIHSLIAVS